MALIRIRIPPTAVSGVAPARWQLADLDEAAGEARQILAVLPPSAPQSLTVASSTSSKVDRTSQVVAILLALVGYALGALALASGNNQGVFVVSANWSAFGALFILALAVERLIEPFSEHLGPSTADAKQQRDKAVAEAERIAVTPASEQQPADGQKSIADAANTAGEEQGKLEQARSKKAIVIWGAATGVAALGCGALHVTLLRAIAAPTAEQVRRPRGHGVDRRCRHEAAARPCVQPAEVKRWQGRQEGGRALLKVLISESYDTIPC